MSRCIDADALEELFREVIGGIAKKPEMNCNLEHMVRASAMVIEMIQDAPTIEPERKKGKCVWCDSPFRIEYYWIDREGCTASFQDEERHVVATGIARFCPNCGRDLTEDKDDA